MAGSSEQKAYVRGASARLVGNSPADTAAARWTINNLNHLADESTQHHGQLCVPAGAKPYFSQSAPSSTTYQQFDNAPPCPVFMAWKPDGTSTRLAVSLRGYCSGGGTATFRVVLTALDIAGTASRYYPPAASLGITTVAEVSTASATGVDLGPLVLYVSRMSDEWLKPGGFPTTDSAGRGAVVGAYVGQIEVWAIASAGAPFIEAVRVREYVG